jgi:hypothetical protein
MIVVTVSILPGGFEHRRRDVGTLRISNISDAARVSNYAVDVMELANPLTGAPARIGGCSVEQHDRMQSVWALVERAAAGALKADLADL